MIRVALDVLGGDSAPGTPIQGALAALDEWPDGFSVLLVGPPDLIEPHLGGAPRDRIGVIPASEAIDPAEPPALAVRRKRDSSIVRGLEAVRDGEADALISAGSTGAVMAASVLTLGVLPGVNRPPVGAMFPTATGHMLVVDVGAHVNARAHQLHQYARLGSIYLRDSHAVAHPRVGLLNVGEEEEKGDDVAVAAYRLLAADDQIQFVGNVEGHQIIQGPCDVLVCSGFVGNALLKFYESMAGFVVGVLRESGIQQQSEIDRILKFLDYTEYGGAPLLGVAGVTIICHGASPPRAIKNATRAAIESVRSGLVPNMRRSLEDMEAARLAASHGEAS
ncbi:MAG: phosphate acyltransferase PlsX [Gemmatimonadota bacterium]|nr:phosphate acyltransferase PlsX [Gemmatimonadota bacterium]